MKTFSLAFWTFLSYCLLLACEPAQTPPAVLMSDLEAFQSEQVIVTNIEQGILDTLRAGDNGLSFDIETPVILTLSEGRAISYVFLAPGDSLNVTQGEDGTQSLVAATPASSENTYLIDFAAASNKANKDFNFRQIAKLEVDSFLLKLEEKYAPLEIISQKIHSDKEIGEDFKKALAIRLASMKGSDRLSYPDFYKYLNKEEAVLPKDYHAFLEDKFYDNASLLLFQESKSFGDRVNGKDLDFTEFANVGAYFDAIYEQCTKTFSTPVLQNYYQFTTLDNQINFGAGLDGADSLISAFKSQVNNPFLLKSLAASIEPWLSIRKGMAAPDFYGMTRTGEKVHLSDLKGKSVYVDVWATWCGPCIREIPSLKQLEKDMHGRNVEFVSISIDQEKDKEKWLNFIQKESLGGTQIMAEGDWKSEVTQAYNIKGIPRFLLIDAEGNILSANAPRPSSAETKVLIESNS